MIYRYAQINELGFCYGDSVLAGPVEAVDLIPLAELDQTPLGKRWTGSEWEEVPQPEPAPQPRHISVGAFYDRFGVAKYAILADTNPTVQALIKDTSVRKYIDLDRSDLPSGLQLLVDAGHTIDPNAIISAEITPEEKP